MRQVLAVLWSLLVLGCAGLPAAEEESVGREPPPPLVTEYQVRYQSLGIQVTPNFGAVDGSGEFVLVPRVR